VASSLPGAPSVLGLNCARLVAAETDVHKVKGVARHWPLRGIWTCHSLLVSIIFIGISSHYPPLAVHARNRSSVCYCKRSDLVQAVNLDPNPKMMVSLALSTRVLIWSD